MATCACVTGLEASVQTGDIILFSSRHAASHVTKCFTASTWDHCGLVVKLSPKHVLILEYAGGVHLYPLFTRLYSYYAIQGREIAIRKLKTSISRTEMEQQVESFVKSVLGQQPPSIEEMAVAVLKQGPALNAFISQLRGSHEVCGAGRPTNHDTPECAVDHVRWRTTCPHSSAASWSLPCTSTSA